VGATHQRQAGACGGEGGERAALGWKVGWAVGLVVGCGRRWAKKGKGRES
jgi:hypothetical protein